MTRSVGEVKGMRREWSDGREKEFGGWLDVEGKRDWISSEVNRPASSLLLSEFEPG